MQAIRILADKEETAPQGELLCTRTWLPGEKVKSSKKAAALNAASLCVGGLCFKAGAAKQPKPEDKDESGFLLLQEAQPKHCSHLLK